MAAKAKTVQTPAVGTTPKGVDDIAMSVGNVRAKEYPATKTSGIKVRGTGAATKGTLARGPMG
jgi:hypothetical protein